MYVILLMCILLLLILFIVVIVRWISLGRRTYRTICPPPTNEQLVLALREGIIALSTSDTFGGTYRYIVRWLNPLSQDSLDIYMKYDFIYREGNVADVNTNISYTSINNGGDQFGIDYKFVTEYNGRVIIVDKNGNIIENGVVIGALTPQTPYPIPVRFEDTLTDDPELLTHNAYAVAYVQ